MLAAFLQCNRYPIRSSTYGTGEENNMGFLDRLLGREEPQRPASRDAMGRSVGGGYNNGPAYSMPSYGGNAAAQPQVSLTDQQALARYRYMLQTAPPEAIEEAHTEAFARLTPEQRRLALQQLSQDAPAHERPQNDDPRSLARAATRAEMRQPGTMERSFGGAGMGGGMGGGMGMGGMMAGSLLATVAGTFIGSAIAHQFFAQPAVAADYNNSADAQSAGDTADPAAEAEMGNVDSDGNVDPYGDPGAQDPYGDPGADAGADSGWGDSGGDFGGGDFGGGDF
jgi:hypothetical protein